MSIAAKARTTTTDVSGAWVAVSATMAAVAWGGNAFTPLLIMYRQVSDFSTLTVDILLGAYVLGIVPALLIGGPLSDRYGRRPLLLPAAPLSLLGSLVIAIFPDNVPMLALGRVLCGVALGLVMAVGTTWIKELSATDDAAAGPRRAAVSLTLGFLVGAGVASLLAQWGPWQTHLPYGVHIVITVITGVWLFSVPETRTVVPAADRVPLRQDLRIPPVGHRRFLRVVLPVAPWVFGAVGSAYAVLPGLVSDQAGDFPIAFAGLLTVITLLAGFGVQMVARHIDTDSSARASVTALTILVVGMCLASWASASLSLALVVIAAMTLGAGYGIALVAGLAEVQRIATADDLAGLTAVYYSIAYLGFFIPAIMASLANWFGYPQMFGFGVGAALLSLAIVAAASTAHLPTRSYAGQVELNREAAVLESAI